MRTLPYRLAEAAAVASVLLPGLANACPVCFSTTSDSVLQTYYMTAAVMTAVPLLMLGTIGSWLYVRATRPRRRAGSPSRGGGAPGGRRT